MKPTIHKRIVFWLVLPVVAVGIATSGALISYLSPPMESFLIEHFEANLRLVSRMGMGICETHFTQLLDMRLEDNAEMNKALKTEALEEIKSIGKQVPNVHMLVLENRQFIKKISIDFPQNFWKLPAISDVEETILDSMLGEESIKANIRYFPFWDWHIISFVYENDYLAPISTARQIIYLSTMGVLAAVFITLLFVFHHFVTNPLNRLIAATKDVSRGQLLSVDPIQDNEIGQLMTFFNSMVESLKKKTEEVGDLIDQLRESEARYRSLVELSPEAVFVHQDGIIKYINRSGAKIFGSTNPAELIGKPAMELIHPDSYEATSYWIEKVKNDHITLPPQELKYVKIDKQAIDVEATGTYIEYSGKPAMLSVVRDITERKQLESRLRQAQKMEAIGTLAGGIAHDFNNILFPLVGYSEILKQDLPADSPSQAHIDEVLRAALRSKDLVKQILAFSRQGDQDLKPIKLQPIVKEAINLLRSSIPTTIDIQHDIDPNCGIVIADSTQIHQVLMNLATNAYHAMEEAGGVLKVSLQQKRLESDQLTFPELTPGEYVRLTVADTGVGIEKHVMKKIFDPYFTTKETGKGTGLGLSVVQGIVKSCNGDISIDSQPGKGTAVQVYLPIIDRKNNDIRTDRNEAIRGGPEKILLVDDEAPIVRMEQQMLERLGYQVATRTGSLEALEAFKANPDSFDLVITDMTMPNMTGVQLSREIKQIRPNIPFILCTGFSYQINDEKSKALGIEGFVMKPVLMKELAGTVRKVIDKKKES